MHGRWEKIIAPLESGAFKVFSQVARAFFPGGPAPQKPRGSLRSGLRMLIVKLSYVSERADKKHRCNDRSEARK
jgi:hypothetical protein